MGHSNTESPDTSAGRAVRASPSASDRWCSQLPTLPRARSGAPFPIAGSRSRTSRGCPPATPLRRPFDVGCWLAERPGRPGWSRDTWSCLPVPQCGGVHRYHRAHEPLDHASWRSPYEPDREGPADRDRPVPMASLPGSRHHDTSGHAVLPLQPCSRPRRPCRPRRLTSVAPTPESKPSLGAWESTTPVAW